MFWPYAPISRRDLVALILIAALAIGILIAGVWIPHSANPGFGPDWSCENFPESGAVCVKKPATDRRRESDGAESGQ
jgi:hypothetical protein